MNVVGTSPGGSLVETTTMVSAPFIVRGVLVEGAHTRHSSRDLGIDFTSPKIDLDSLITQRCEQGPLFEVKVAEIIDFLAATGDALSLDDNSYLRACIERTAATNVLPSRILERNVQYAREYLRKASLLDVISQNFPDPRCLDEWVPRQDHAGRRSSVRAFPPRLINVLPGNSPVAAVQSIAHAALVKAVSLFKMASSDPFTTVAILRTMIDIDPGHPVVRSMSAVYWRGGDESIERVLYRPQYFDKIVAWGGGDAITNVIKYIGPGLQLVSFDPKTSISLVGAEAFESDKTLDDAADRAATDVTILNQEACTASRFIFIEGTPEQIDEFCARLFERLGVDRELASADAPRLPASLSEEIDSLRMLADEFRIWGKGDGRGLVIRSETPVDFSPTGKTVNVVPVPSLSHAVRYVNVATQTVGVYPFHRKPDLRDALASAGAQRTIRLGDAGKVCTGNPHDAMYPLHRFVHWVSDEDAGASE